MDIVFFFFQAEVGIRVQERARGLGNVYKGRGRDWLGHAVVSNFPSLASSSFFFFFFETESHSYTHLTLPTIRLL